LPNFGIMLLKAQNASQPVTDALASHIDANFQAGAPRLADSLTQQSVPGSSQPRAASPLGNAAGRG
jgi:hypothetical protein